MDLEREAGPATLDCSKVERFGPLGVALVASSIALRQHDGRPTTFVPPRAKDADAFVREVGLDRFARGERTGLGTLEIRQMHALDAVYSEGVTEMVLRGVPGMTEENSYSIQLCLNELLQNVFEWAHSPIGCVVLARWYLKTRSVRLAVVDRGIGIPAALRREKVRELHRASDAAVIEAAVTTPQLTSRENRVGGLGLKTIRQTVCERGGRLTVISLSAKVTWSGGTVRKARTVPLKGTAIEIDIRPDAPVSEREPVPMVF